MIMAEKPPLFVFVRSGLNVPSPLQAKHPRREIKNNIYNHGRSGIKRLSSILVALADKPLGKLEMATIMVIPENVYRAAPYPQKPIENSMLLA